MIIFGFETVHGAFIQSIDATKPNNQPASNIHTTEKFTEKLLLLFVLWRFFFVFLFYIFFYIIFWYRHQSINIFRCWNCFPQKGASVCVPKYKYNKIYNILKCIAMILKMFIFCPLALIFISFLFSFLHPEIQWKIVNFM